MATQRMREYIVTGFALDDERLQRTGGGNDFEEKHTRLRDIASSEKYRWLNPWSVVAKFATT